MTNSSLDRSWGAVSPRRPSPANSQSGAGPPRWGHRASIAALCTARRCTELQARSSGKPYKAACPARFHLHLLPAKTIGCMLELAGSVVHSSDELINRQLGENRLRARSKYDLRRNRLRKGMTVALHRVAREDEAITSPDFYPGRDRGATTTLAIGVAGTWPKAHVIGRMRKLARSRHGSGFFEPIAIPFD